MFLKINDELIPLDGTYVNLKYSYPAERTPGVLLATSHGAKFRFTDEVAEAARAFFASLEKKAGVVDLNKAFKRAQEATEILKLTEPLPSRQVFSAFAKLTPCPLTDLHSQMAIPCPSCGTPPATQEAPGSIPNPQLLFPTPSEEQPPWKGFNS